LRRRADDRTRTGDPFITSEVLYQLSYVGDETANCLQNLVILLAAARPGIVPAEQGAFGGAVHGRAITVARDAKDGYGPSSPRPGNAAGADRDEGQRRRATRREVRRATLRDANIVPPVVVVD
jgi:hypothetical protein